MTKPMKNRLANEKSPYLLQHAHNPVDWYPWGDEAFARAASEDKPIFLSIGYSTCHWCHVMEHETFEDEEAAQILNENFIAIKVDREERPDIDSIYMNVCQSLTGSGGWPLSIFMTPDGKAFQAGTYYPKKDRYGRVGFISLAERISAIWKKDRERLLGISEEVFEALNFSKSSEKKHVSESVVKSAYEYFSKHFDKRFGGFGNAPKFPSPHNLMFLLRYYHTKNDSKALEMVEKTLKSMYYGGIFDHIGYGFSRYSTDHRWLVPHFEKMLYDNALLSIVYTEAYQVTQNDFYQEVSRKILSYIIRAMSSEEGGFYSAEDADSEGVEGKFYVWEKAEIINILGEETGKSFCHIYDITEDGNFEGKNIPNLILSQYDSDEGFINECRRKLFEAREKRIHPYKDDKILTSWNGLMIAAFARAGRVFDEKLYIEISSKSVEFIYNHLFDTSGRLYSRYREGERAHKAYIDDYAFLSWGLLELFDATFKTDYLKKVIYLVNEMIRLFWDDENFGFFFTGIDAEELVKRPKESYEGAIPSGNSVAAYVLQRIYKITDEFKWQEKLDQLFMGFSDELEGLSPGHTFMISVFLGELTKSSELVILDFEDSQRINQLIHKINRSFKPYDRLIFLNNKNSDIRELIPRYKEYTTIETKPTAYFCKNNACLPPITDFSDLLNLIHQ